MRLVLSRLDDDDVNLDSASLVADNFLSCLCLYDRWLTGLYALAAAALPKVHPLLIGIIAIHSLIHCH